MSTLKPATIRTDRLDLVPVRVEHAEEMAAVLADSALYTFIGGAPESVQALRARYRRWTAGSPDPAVTWCNWVVRLREEDRLAGTVQATVTADGRGATAEVAWLVGTAWQRRGIATEAARGLTGWLREHPGDRPVHTVLAHIHPDHAASAAVAAALGLSPTEQWQDGEVRWRLASG